MPHAVPFRGLLQLEPLSLWQATADSCLLRRLSNTQRQIWHSLLWRSLLLSLGPGAPNVLFGLGSGALSLSLSLSLFSMTE